MSSWEEAVKDTLEYWNKKLDGNKVDIQACEAELERLKEYRLEINCAIVTNKNRLKIAQCEPKQVEENEHC